MYRSKSKCQHCSRSHHSFLRFDDAITQKNDQNAIPENKTASLSNTSTLLSGVTLLPIAIVDIETPHRNKCTCRAVVDSGSDASFVTDEFVNRVALTPVRHATAVTGIGHLTSTTKGTARFVLLPRNRTSPKLIIDSYVLSKIIRNIPETK
ncbi:hypothetical protein EVAR_101622_1 [Eumeta japonica]|uniref:Peptidase A2 domain-containing protein n=1 Tax=Eumeta variegata TaxID=151549 RepID=A0A4C1SFI3_EUMVA|nr:hypothetical protein EVAR_101622_1 [Eumeta japonica]